MLEVCVLIDHCYLQTVILKFLLVGKVAKVAVAKFDAITMHERPALAAESQLVDDGTGDLKIWKFVKSSVVEVLKPKHGIFYSGDCYLILYTYEAPSQKNIIYYWLVSDSN